MTIPVSPTLIIAFRSQAYQLGLGSTAYSRKLYIKQNDNGLSKIEVYFPLT